MIKSDKKLKELDTVFSKGNNIDIDQAIRKLRDEEPFSGAISLLVKLYDSNIDKSLSKLIQEFFNDIPVQPFYPQKIVHFHNLLVTFSIIIAFHAVKSPAMICFLASFTNHI